MNCGIILPLSALWLVLFDWDHRHIIGFKGMIETYVSDAVFVSYLGVANSVMEVGYQIIILLKSWFEEIGGGNIWSPHFESWVNVLEVQITIKPICDWNWGFVFRDWWCRLLFSSTWIKLTHVEFSPPIEFYLQSLMLIDYMAICMAYSSTYIITCPLITRNVRTSRSSCRIRGHTLYLKDFWGAVMNLSMMMFIVQ